MKFNQDDATLETDPQVETSSQSPSNHERQDVRRVIARDLPLEAFFDGGREQTFASLGRVSATPEEVLSWQLHPDKRQTIERLIITNSNGKTPDLEKAGISSADILAFAAQGSKPTASKLEEANQLWWKLRENEPLWRSQCSQQKPSFLERLQERRARKVIDKIIAELDFDERESSTLFKTERFSRRTVYARDYAVIPKKLRALFKMVPDLIFAPRTSAQLQRFLAYASEHKINVAPRGRGTWALGGALLTKGGVVLELASFEKKIEVDPKQQKITVSASVDFQEAEEALNRDGLTLKARPSNKYGVIAGFLSVGEPLQGGLGLNAYGIGHIRNCVESIRVVTSRGEEKSIKNDDPDFPYYFGTNGRYGIITEVILEAAKKPAKHHPVALRFESAKNAFEFLLGFRKDVQSGYLEAHPVHIEFYGKDYLDEIKKIKSAQDPSITVNLISPESIKRNTPTKDAVLFVFYDKEDSEAFLHYVEERDGCGLASQSEASELWDERFSPMKLRRKGDLLTAEVILPLDKVQPYLKQVTQFASKLGLKILPVAYILDFNEALVLPQFITDRRRRFQYYRHFSLIPVLARRAIKGFHGRPYGYGIWFSGLARRAMGHELFQDLTQAKKRLDPKGILNPGKLSEIGSRLWNSLGTLLLHERAVDTLDRLLQFQGYLSCFKKFREVFLSNKAYSYFQERGDAMHRCIKCSACMICPLAQIWEKSGDPKLKKDAIYITPRYKMEYMQQHLYEGKKLSQEDVDRFVLCFRCGVAERETVCPISDMLLTVEESESTPCEKKLPTYDDFEAQLRQEGYDVDGAIQRYMDILKTHPGVAHAMQDVLGKYRIPKTGDLTVLQPKTDFAIYKVNVDENRCINCGKCGDEHTTSQRGFWDPRYPRKMVSLDDLLREMHGKIPENWFSDRDGPIPAKIKEQGQSNGEFVHFRNPADSDQGHHHCNGCLYCVIECPVDAIRVSINDYYAELAGEDFTREDIRRLNEEARTGGVPTSGTGSTGVFGGKGFDRFMFDFSVIVRPTRDGIREAIDIGVNLGRKPLFHLFEDARRGDKFPKMRTRVETLDLPTPILLELPLLHGRSSSRDLIEVFGRCAQQEDTVVILDLFQFIENFEIVSQFAKHVGLRLLPEELQTIQAWVTRKEIDDKLLCALREIPLLEIAHEASEDADVRCLPVSQEVREKLNPKLIVSQLLVCPLNSDPQNVTPCVEALAKSSAEIIHLKTQFNAEKGYYESVDILPACYERLLVKSLHSQVTLIANGIKSPADLGIATMLGAGAVVIDRAALVALNYEFPMLEKKGEVLPEIEIEYGIQKLQNLFNSWHKQIREVLGAFGVRDIRRTVGERGRLIDLREREIKMRSIVEDAGLREASNVVNKAKILEDEDLARKASWTFSGLSKLVKPVSPPNENLSGDRSQSLKSMLEVRGDRRWNAEMLSATWMMASGQVPSHKVPQTGCDFGGGSFDVMRFAPVQVEGKILSLDGAVEDVYRKVQAGDLNVLKALDAISISAGELNRHRRPQSPPLVNHFPIDAADMSLGSIGWKLTLARYLAGAILKRHTGTGEGGYPLENYDRLLKFFPNLSRDEVHWLAAQMERWVATQTATGYFGVNEDTIRRADKLVLKFAQGAKPGLGGHILGAKVTSQVEDLRGVVAGISVFSPFPFHDVYSIEDVTKMIEWLRTINPDAIISVKISTPVDVYHVALGLVSAGADEIQIDATAGGTGAAPDIARNRIAMPLEYGLADVHKFLVEQGERNNVVLVASGGIRSAYDVAKAMILGADKVLLGTQEIVSQQCNRCGNCEAPGGCQKGITTTVEQLEQQKEILLNTQWLINSQVAVVQHVIKMMYVWGMKDIRELRGRTDLISDWGWEGQENGRWRIGNRTSASNNKSRRIVNEWDEAKEERKELDACGVVSFACTQAVPVESIQTACQRMHNRGNGRGGGILGLGGMFSPELEDCYALQVIVLSQQKQREEKILEIVKRYLKDFYLIDRFGEMTDPSNLTGSELEAYRNPRRQKDGRDIAWQQAGLQVDPGDMYRFFIRVKKTALLRFAREVLEKCQLSPSEKAVLENGNPTDFLKRVNISGKWLDYFVKYFDLLTDEYLDSIDPKSDFWQQPEYEAMWRDLEDEFVYRRAFEINQKYYIEPQDRSENPEAFVSSMMKDGGIWKLVGYAEQAADYWLIGDAQYVTLRDLERIVRNVLEETDAKNRNDQISKIKAAIRSFRSENGQPKSISNKCIKTTIGKNQLEIEIFKDKNQQISVIVPKARRRAVVVFKYGAHIWIGHQRFPTVFSPYSGGSHPFYGRVHEALIHNGDFANYVAMVRFWDQFGGAPQFRTDTEMAAKAYAILKQMGYPQSHIFEAIAPTTGIDMQRLRKSRRELAADLENLQKTHIAGSPDGPWFFIIGDQDPDTRNLKVIGLTDTSVLRPSIFVWQENANGRYASIGLVGSEEQACRCVLDSLHRTGILASKEPDATNIIRGGSVEQEGEENVCGGGAIVYNLERKNVGKYNFKVSDKFGHVLSKRNGQHYDLKTQLNFDADEVQQIAVELFRSNGQLKFKKAGRIFDFVRVHLKDWEYNSFRWFVETLGNYAQSEAQKTVVIKSLTLLKDHIQRINTGSGRRMKKRSSCIHILTTELETIFDHIKPVDEGSKRRRYFRLTFDKSEKIFQCKSRGKTLVVDATDFPPEGHQSLAQILIQAHRKGWRKFIVYRITGQRYLGAGFGPNTQDLEIHLYGSPGQDIANSLMGGTVHVHADAQNDMGKILHSGTVVVHGLAGNTGIYGAKGGEVFVRDSVGTRWIINSVSSPVGPGLKVTIVGSAMEYLAESLMGGLVLMLGLEWDEHGILRRKYLPFAGNSVLAGASAGKVIIYDPDNRIEDSQYANAVDIGFLSRDWLSVSQKLTSLVKSRFEQATWINHMQRWRPLAELVLRNGMNARQNQDTLNELFELMQALPERSGDFKRLQQDSVRLKSLIEEKLTGKAWRTLVRQLSQTLPNDTWQEGIEVLERLMDWQDVTDLLKKADQHFALGLKIENDELYLPIDGEKTEIRREDFRVLRPRKPHENTEEAK